MTVRNALILAGSGMLNPVAGRLATEGWRVVQPCRRYSPLPTEAEPGPPLTPAVPWPRGGTPPEDLGAGRVLWAQAHWDEPCDLARRVENLLTAPAELVVAWVHESFAPSVLAVVEPLVAPGAPVVEVRSAPDLHGLPKPPEPLLPGHPTQQLVLGAVSGRGTGRPLGQAEIVECVLDTVGRALAGHVPSLVRVGEPRPVTSPRPVPAAAAGRGVSVGVL